MLVAKITDQYAINQMASLNGDFLTRRVVLSGLSHGETPAELQYNSCEASHYFRLKQDALFDCGPDNL